MTLPNWWQVTTLHKDIREGQMEESTFAADLSDAVKGKASLEYRDASIFFEKTYLTKGLMNLLENVLSRLANGKGSPVIQLQTPFGGGKTHSLLALYHAVKNRDQVQHIDSLSNLPVPKNAKVVVLVGLDEDPIKGKTPWGEIAHQLGVYEKVKEHDEKRLSPGRRILDEILGDDPVLILIDELVEYVVKAKDFDEQIRVFSHEITETVKSKDNSCLVCTLPSSTPYGETGDRALNDLQRIYGRVEAVYTPVEGVEIYEVIRKRLFEDIGDEKVRKEIAQAYFEMYNKLGADVPSEVREIEYRKRIEHAYPFHPELIDVLYERWGSYPNFQRTRGLLRLLAKVVADLYKRRVVSPLIQSSLVNLGEQTIRKELIKIIGNSFESVTASDIAGQNARAPKIDKEMGSEYEKYGIAKGIATSIFLYSFNIGEKKGLSVSQLRVAFLREGIPFTIVGDVIDKLTSMEKGLWYLHQKGNLYVFKNEPNLWLVIGQKEETISEKRIKESLEENLKKYAGRAFEVYLWPESASDIPDNKSLKLAILSPDFSYDSEKGKKLASELSEKAGTGFRVYKNTLFILAMESAQYSSLYKSLKRFLALSDIQNDKGLFETLTKENQDELRKKLKDVEKEIPFKILTTYRHLAFLEENGLNWVDMGIPTAGTGSIITERVKQYLQEEDKILTKLTPKHILDKAFATDEDEKELRDIYELYLKTPGRPILEDEEVLINAVKEGVKSGFLGIKENKDIFYKQNVDPTMDAVILRGDFANDLLQKAKAEELKEEIAVKTDDKVKDKDRKEAERVKKSGTVKKINLSAKVPWDKLSDVVRGVIAPLKEKGQDPKIIIKIESVGEFDRTTLDTKVKETLQQIGAEIEDWVED